MKTAELRALDSAQLRERKQALVARLQPVESIMRGSLIERFLRCGKPSCHCQSGKGHGPKHYLSISHPKSRPEMIYVPQNLADPVRESLANFAALRAQLDELCAINAELMRRREEL